MAAQGLDTNTLVSITFNQADDAGATAIYALSGALSASQPQVAAAITSQPTDATVPELTSATFTAGVSGNPLPALQWYRNGTPIPGATDLSYATPATTLADSGALYRLVASNMANNVSCSVTSSVAMLTVTPVMKPLAVSGFNLDVIIESTASGPPYSGYASGLPGENNCFYQSGLSGHSYGLPGSGSFLSTVDGTLFQFAPYTTNNVLALSASTGTSATLTLAAPQVFRRIALIAHSGSGGGTPTLTLNFTDGSTFITNYDAPDWFGNAGYALAGVERIDPSFGRNVGRAGQPPLLPDQL